jgi:hypothetical protein
MEYPLYRRLDGSQDRFGRVRNILPMSGFDPRIVQSVASRCTDWAVPAVTLLCHFQTVNFRSTVKIVYTFRKNELFFSAYLIDSCLKNGILLTSSDVRC